MEKIHYSEFANIIKDDPGSEKLLKDIKKLLNEEGDCSVYASASGHIPFEIFEDKPIYEGYTLPELITDYEAMKFIIKQWNGILISVITLLDKEGNHDLMIKTIEVVTDQMPLYHKQ